MDNMACMRNILIQRSRIVKEGTKGLQSTKFCVLLLFSVMMIVGLFTLSPTFSSLMNSVVINSTGRISLSSITAKSGSPIDIQTAVNAVAAAGGGTVYIPAGTFTFNPPMDGTGVSIPPNVSVIGAGAGVTILQETINSGSSFMFDADGQINSGPTQGTSIRISAISFIGFVLDESNTFNNGIDMEHQKDFRIDHCNFQNFANMAIFCTANTGGTYPLTNRGVIDHCSFDNPYKDRFQPHNSSAPGDWAVWGYGIVVVGNDQSIRADWDPNIADYLGQYYGIMYNGYSIPSAVYIENCNFTRCRHAISANGGGYYVSRYNYFEKCSSYGQNDAHGGGAGGYGTRGIESYSNVFNFADESYSFGQDAAVEMRGGGGVCWNNTVILNPSYGTPTVTLSSDGESPPYDVEQFYIWNNTAVWTNGTAVNFNSRIDTGDYTQNVNYFLRAPNQTLDGFTYTPFTYPHPLTLQTTP